MSEDSPPDLGISVGEEIQTDESLSKYARWFNGMKFFYMVKLLPPK